MPLTLVAFAEDSGNEGASGGVAHIADVLDDRYVYVGGQDNLIVWDVLDPLAPTFGGRASPVIAGVANFHSGDHASRLFISGAANPVLKVVSCAARTAPVVSNSSAPPGNIPGFLWADATRLYGSSTSQEQLLIWDTSAAPPTLIGQATGGSSSVNQHDGGVKIGDYFYHGMNKLGLVAIWDVNPDTTPTVAGSVAVSGTPRLSMVSVNTTTNVAFVYNRAGSGSVVAVDVSNVASPTIISTLTDVASLRLPLMFGQVLVGTRLYLASNSKVTEVDVSDPAAMVITGSVANPAKSGQTMDGGGLVILGGGAYLASNTAARLNIFNIATGGWMVGAVQG